ncbi:hypothetical protein MMPV_004667 [Pyropia vietnamensis]
MAIMPSRHGGNPGEVTCYLQLINWLLRLHADEETLALQVEEFSKATQQAAEDERAFATRLRHLNVLCGFIHSEAMLKSRFVEGCHKAERSTVRERNTPSLTLAELARIAQTNGDEYRWFREEQRKASALEHKRLAEANRAARPTRPEFVPGVRPRDKPVPAGVDPAKFVVSLTGNNYQIATRVWLSPGYEVALRVILDTGSGVSLIRRELLPEDTQYNAVDKSTPRIVGGYVDNFDGNIIGANLVPDDGGGNDPLLEPGPREESPKPHILKDSVPESVQERLTSLLDRHHKLWNGELGLMKATEHRIKLKYGSKPVRLNPYGMSSRSREVTRRMAHLGFA